MTRISFLILLLVISAQYSYSAFTKQFELFGKVQRRTNIDVDPGNSLILTPLIEQDRIEEARNASEIHHQDFQGIKCYSGFLTVNESFDSNLFFWFFPAQIDYENAPVVLWLQGGPGGSSLYGLFVENGPFVFTGEDQLAMRNYSWAKTQSVIYIDNPAGTGFSFTNGGFCREQTQVGEELYNALVQFFKLFPELQKNDFFVSGESYAGKYVPAIAHTIHKKNPEAELKINLKGVAIGDGYSDPKNQNRYSNFLYEIGMIDENQKIEMEGYESLMRAYITAEQWVKATDLFDKLMELFSEFSGVQNYYNFLTQTDPTSLDSIYLNQYLERNDIRAALHVGNASYHSMDDVYEALRPDMTKSVAPWVSEILNHYRVLIYNGQVDVIVAYPLTINYLQNLDFNAADEYKTAERFQWYADGDLAGYVKQAGNLTEVLIRDAGHMVPYDQPKWAYDLIFKFTRNIKLY